MDGMNEGGGGGDDREMEKGKKGRDKRALEVESELAGSKKKLARLI